MLLSHLSICFGYFCCINFFAVFESYKVGYDLNGERMPELRSGARRSKRLGDLQTAVPTRRTAAGRGRGARLIDLDPEPCEALPEPVALRAQEPVYNHVEVVANNNILMEGVSGDKAAAAEEEATTASPLLVTSFCSFIPIVVLTAPLPSPVSSTRDTLPPLMVILTAPGMTTMMISSHKEFDMYSEWQETANTLLEAWR
ncbi:hypothetical protein P8452_66605 [Trifolium repens]|nr:hypothetical protein P8452_66605 [Trifolium repens]